VLLLQPEGQHPSPPRHWEIVWWPQVAVQSCAVPLSVSVVQALPSLQDVGQDPGGSQVSPGSILPLPHLGPGTTTLISSAVASVPLGHVAATVI